MEIGTRRLEIADDSGVGEARRIASGFANRLGMDEVDVSRVAIVATELARNLWKQAGGGVMLIGLFEDETGAGVECLALDTCPGIVDVEAALRHGYSTAGATGAGLGAVRRLSHAFDGYSQPGKGSAFMARRQAGAPQPENPSRPVRLGRRQPRQAWGGRLRRRLARQAPRRRPVRAGGRRVGPRPAGRRRGPSGDPGLRVPARDAPTPRQSSGFTWLCDFDRTRDDVTVVVAKRQAVR